MQQDRTLFRQRLSSRQRLSPRRGPCPPLLLLSGFLVCGLIACAGDPPPPPPEVYTSRGMVRQLPAEGPARSDLYIHHEAIEDFKDEDGKVIGMEAMAMPFAVAESADLSGLKAGDRVRFTFEVYWHGGDPLRVTAIDGLGSDVRLDFEMSEEGMSEEMSEAGSDTGADHESHHAPADEDAMTDHDHGNH